MGTELFYVGSFSDEFYLCELETQSGRLSRARSVKHPKPEHMAVSADRTRLYVTAETFGEEGRLSAYDISNPYNPLPISAVPADSQGCCYISVSRDGRHLFGCGYFDGVVDIFPISGDGALGERCHRRRLTGTGTAFIPGSFGQAVPRAHCVLQMPQTGFLLVSDYSGDQLLCFRLTGGPGEFSPGAGAAEPCGRSCGFGGGEACGEVCGGEACGETGGAGVYGPAGGAGAAAGRATASAAAGAVKMHQAFALDFPKGSAPRHFAPHPSIGGLAYLVTEFSSELYAIRIDPDSGELSILSSAGTMPGGQAEFSSCVSLSPDGGFIYVPNRRNENISVFSLANNPERPEFVGCLPETGFVRDARTDPSGAFLIAGDQKGNLVRLYQRNRQNGMCAPLAAKLELPCPASFVFLRAEAP
jgi:6-phosphogluconolactonase (cycloisomerase 2 family)